jgi:hypothetical protein
MFFPKGMAQQRERHGSPVPDRPAPFTWCSFVSGSSTLHRAVDLLQCIDGTG